jgi:hypothetical protein
VVALFCVCSLVGSSVALTSFGRRCSRFKHTHFGRLWMRVESAARKCVRQCRKQRYREKERSRNIVARTRRTWWRKELAFVVVWACAKDQCCHRTSESGSRIAGICMADFFRGPTPRHHRRQSRRSGNNGINNFVTMNHHPSYLHTIKWDRDCDDDDDGDNGHHRQRLAFELEVGRNFLDLAGPAAPRSLHAPPGTAIPKADEPFCASTWCWTMDDDDDEKTDGTTAAQPVSGSSGPVLPTTTTIRLSKNSVTALTYRSGRGVARFTVQFDDIEGSFTYERTEKKEKPIERSERLSTGDSQETVAMGSSLQQQQRLSQLSTQSLEQRSAGTTPGGSSWGMTS